MGGHTFVGDETDTETAQSFIDLIYETADGYISVAAMHDKHWEGLSRALKRPDFLTDPRFSTPELREINKQDRLNLTQEGLKPHATKDVLRLLEAEDVPCAPVLTRKEMRTHPQIAANEIIVESNHPEAGCIRHTRPAAVFSQTQTELRFGAPVLGEHTREVLQEVGLDAPEIETLLSNGGARQAGEHDND